MHSRTCFGLFTSLSLFLVAGNAAAQSAPPAYNRSIGDITITPSAAAGDSFFDVWVDLRVSRDASMSTVLDLSTEVMIEVDGTAVASIFTDLFFDPPFGDCDTLGCPGNPTCSSLSVNGIMQPGFCEIEHPGDDTYLCRCMGVVQLPFTMIPAEPGGQILILLLPAPGALPELPGFEEDDEARVRVLLEGTRSFCAGDGSGGACPCANHGDVGQGCENSTGSGGELFASGSVEVGEDDLLFHAANLPASQPALLFYGTAWINGGDGVPFGDGLRCVGGQLVRLGIESADAAGEAAWGPGLAAQEGWAANDHYAFQVWYRDQSGPCQTGFNLTNALDVILEP